VLIAVDNVRPLIKQKPTDFGNDARLIRAGDQQAMRH
jgi:hypothetical protein